jgi:hypothetical protein
MASWSNVEEIEIKRLRAEKGGLVSTIEGLRHDMENAERRGFAAGVEAAAKWCDDSGLYDGDVDLDTMRNAAKEIRALSPKEHADGAS